jgi:hypothetical protein
LRRKRQLYRQRKQGSITDPENNELIGLNTYITLEAQGFFATSLISWLRSSRKYLYVVFLFLIIIYAGGSAGLAYLQADQVRQGISFWGDQSSFFEYSAEPVQVKPLSKTTPNTVGQLEGERLFLLGQNAQYVILYWPEKHATIRIPVATVIVTSSR